MTYMEQGVEQLHVQEVFNIEQPRGVKSDGVLNLFYFFLCVWGGG